jgi:hypothetical protein
MKWTLIALTALFLASCGTHDGPPAVDMRPVGEGLKLIGYALVGVSVVLVMGTMLRPRP